MPNVITHKANRANDIFSIAGNAGNASASVVLYQDFFFGGVNKNLSYLNGTTEPTVGDNVIVGGEIIGKLESYTLTSGTWAGNDAGGALTLSKMTTEASFPDAWTTSSGGAGQSGATEVEIRETSITDSSVSDLAVSAISDSGTRINANSGDETPNNAINWTESDSTEIYESLLLVVCKATVPWTFYLGDSAGTGGYIKIDSGGKSGTVKGADNTIVMSGADAFITDGTVHTYAVLLKGGLSPSYSFEVDGIETASDSGTNAGLIDMSVENQMHFTGLTPLGILALRFKRGIPSDYRLAIAEMKAAWEAGEVGISSRFIGV